MLFKQHRIKVHEHTSTESRPRGYKKNSCSTQLSMKFFLLINVNMPTVVGILIFMSRKCSIIGFAEPAKS